MSVTAWMGLLFFDFPSFDHLCYDISLAISRCERSFFEIVADSFSGDNVANHGSYFVPRPETWLVSLERRWDHVTADRWIECAHAHSYLAR